MKKCCKCGLAVTELQVYNTMSLEKMIKMSFPSQEFNHFYKKLKETDAFLSAFFNHLYTDDIKIVVNSGALGLKGSTYRFEGDDDSKDNLIHLQRFEQVPTTPLIVICKIKHRSKVYIFEFKDMKYFNVYARSNKLQEFFAHFSVRAFGVVFSEISLIAAFTLFLVRNYDDDEVKYIALPMGLILLAFLLCIPALMDCPLFAANPSEAHARLERDMIDFFKDH